MYQSILQMFPASERAFYEYIASREQWITEIRLRCEKPILIMESEKEWFLDKDGRYTNNMAKAILMKSDVLKRIVQHICSYSMYAFEEEIRQGFITVSGGHRVGLVGQVVTENGGEIRTIKHISGVNIRVSHQKKGVGQKLLPYLYKDGNFRSTLIVSPPGCGKTTLLRDLIRYVSNGNEYAAGQTVGVVDERSEIAGAYMGQPQNDMGIRTDVLDACPKVSGMMLLLRAMSPKVIAIDELGSPEELAAVSTVSNCGVKILATMHAENLEDLYRREGVDTLLSQRRFEMILILYKDNGHYSLKAMYEWDDKGGWKCCDY